MGINTKVSYDLNQSLNNTSSLPQYPLSPVSIPDTSFQPSAPSSEQNAQYRQSREGHAVPAEQRQNPRRSSSQAQKPPTLVRQDERKVSFVDSLVDSATQMVEVIWPLSVAPPACRPNASGVLSLRRYIEETLRRSRTSYSTLQVALYYLVLIMPLVPKCDFTREQLVDSPSMRSLQCGRRMFLSALILASKYLQDRNYSAKAWSKMSGLKVAEINMNERAFLQSVNWKLHIPDTIFKRWTDIVLRYTPSQFPPPPGQNFSATGPKCSWKDVIPLLTPELDMLPVPAGPVVASPETIHIQTPFASLPSFLEPIPEVVPPTPEFVRNVPALPTPRPTPPPRSYTPAVSVANAELWPTMTHAPSSRRASLASSGSSLGSSPESTFSDAPRLSRSSSISSVSTSITSMSSQTSFSAQSYSAKPTQSTQIVDTGITCSPVSVSYDEIKPFLATQARSARGMPIIVGDNSRAMPKQGLQYSVQQMLTTPLHASVGHSRKRSHCGQSDVEGLPRKQRCLSVAAH